MKINIKNIKVRSICVTLFISLFLSCNNGIEELEKQRDFILSISNLRQSFLDIFTSFGDSLGGVLGFKSETKKSEIGDYFKTVKETVEGIKGKLNTIVTDMKNENNSNASGTEAAVAALNKKLDQIIQGAKTVSDAISSASDPIANVATGDASGIAGGEVDNLVKGIKSIVEVVLKEGKPDAGTENKADDLGARTGNGEGEAGKLFDDSSNAGSSPKKAAADAAKAVGAVTGADILKAISQGDNGDAAKLAKHNNSNGNAGNSKNDAVIAGGIALRAMAKGGKFANGSSADVSTSVRRVAVSAVTKALNALTIAIKKTIDEGLKTVKEAIKIEPNDTPLISDKDGSEAKS
ncbi:variable large family protein (plasmid) [Borrelia coriaceae]|uniref:Variable large protein n=1 Tax=Borrelia coriaceae ATCC 43381 TaxID=1408429 RepID=W5T1V5_9SPIR|nr:variable large family protein [Borrelia coriaceae]AHH11261.1 Variable outer membrane protein [Borrelia coriaceae ATCC 43381]UPA17432.1 variable large family protein [Borrelia coriaceae]